MILHGRKVVYVARYNGNPSSGVTKKIFAQIRAFESLGGMVDVHLFGFGNAPNNRVYMHQISDLDGTWRRKIRYGLDFNRQLSAVLEAVEQDQVVYIRGFFPSIGMYRILRATRGITVVEIPSSIIGEARLRGSFLTATLYSLLGACVINGADKIVSITHDSLDGMRWLDYSKVMVCGNGVDSEIIRDIGYVRSELTNQIRITCVSNLSESRGIDRLISGLARYKGDTKFVVNIVGAGRAEARLKALASRVQGLHEVIFHGFLDGDDLLSIYQRTDVALAGLGGFRKDLRYVSSLKSREYMAYGIPFLYSGSDEDLDPINRFLLRVSHDESPLELGQVEQYHSNIQQLGRHYVSDALRNYARNNLTWELKLAQIIEEVYCDSGSASRLDT